VRERKKRWGFVVLVSTVLVLVGLLSLTSTAWATPAQTHAQQQSIPPTKEADQTVVCPGESLVFEIFFRAGPTNWDNVVVTDDIDPLLTIEDVMTSKGTVLVVGQLVTVNVGNLIAGETVTIRITCTLEEGASPGFLVENTATAVVGVPELEFDASDYIEVCTPEFIPEPSSLLLLGSGLAGLASYAGMRWSKYRA
jgi:hypothetical protein